MSAVFKIKLIVLTVFLFGQITDKRHEIMKIVDQQGNLFGLN